MAKSAPWFIVLPAAIVAAAPAHGTVYLTLEGAQRAMFPRASDFQERSVTLNKAQRAAVSRAAGFAAPKQLRIWDVRQNGQRIGWFMLDRVLGKHDYITYALAIDPAGRVQKVEVLEYRETYGDEIRNENWRRQFIGKTSQSELKLGRDIKNISGATLSSLHVTQGVKRLLAAFDLLIGKV